MKKLIYLLLFILVGSLLIPPTFAAADAPVITLQPQSPNYPEYSTAIYTVKAEGTNLTATWYMEWMGEIYNISDIGGVMQPWEPYAGETYGATQPDANTFVYFFGGIEYDMDGAYIWCMIEDGHYDVTSQKNRISVGNENSPPEILEFPSALTVEQGAQAELRCVAKSTDESQLSFLWYETQTGHRNDISAVNDGTETADFLICDTSKVGTRNYICQVSSGNGGLTYSSTVSVTVTEKQTPSTEPSAPVEPTTPESQAPTTGNAPGEEQQEDFPWWAIALLAVAAAGIGFGAAALLLKKKN